MSAGLQIPFSTHNDADVEISMTTNVGSISATLNELQRAFGKPLVKPSLQVNYDWRIAFADLDETVASIYDYKRPTTPEPDELISWCIGGHSRKAVELIHETFRHSIGLTQRRKEHFA